ncbi:nephrin isoform X2 [Microcaecilia unicolor]|uniref:Nephrin isoform X2 n=1 Tax=Microcaecilia unicolor TaxID=1415580 RepID=A0A6P7YVF7_9AMPH|nr:nephrin isoform X2 [Microcaecilia unicolor]
MAFGNTFILPVCILLGFFWRGSWSQQQAFRIQPDNVTVLEGGTAILLCEIENPSGVVQWVKDGLLLGPERTISSFPHYSMIGDADKVPPKKPHIEEYEADSVVTWVAGLEYSVTCSASDSKPPSDITLTKSGNELSSVMSHVISGSSEKLSSTQATVKVIPQSTDNGKLLECGATNPATLTPLVTSFIMNVLFPPLAPTIEGYKQPLVKAGEILKLICISHSGNPLATLQWSKNESVISTSWETDDSLRSSRSLLSLNVKPEDNMVVLSCEALNQVTPVPLKTSIALNVVFLPTEVTILGSASVQQNMSIYMSCFTAASNPPVQIRWWLGWRELTTTEVTITDASYGGKVTMSNLTHTALREENGLPLTCEAFNEAILYTKTSSVTINVQYPPQKVWLEAPPRDKYFRAGTTVKMTCFSSGGNPTPRLTWIKENKALRDGSQISSGKIVSKEIVIITAPNDNLATYRCNASNDAKTPALTAHTKLQIQFPAVHVKISTTAKDIRRGQSITLNCATGSSNPYSTVSWLKDGEKLKGVDLGRRNTEFGGLSTFSKVTLVASSSDNGRRVTCQAYNAVLNEAVNTFYKLNILFPPEFSELQLKIVQAVEHGAVLIPLLVSANPTEITYTWSFRGEMLIKDVAPRHHLRDGGSLEIWNLTRSDAGNYRIHCKNAEGENETTIKLDIQYSPSIKSIGDPTEVDIGGIAEIICIADANPVTPSMFEWTWLGDDERDLGSYEKVTQDEIGKLIIRDAKRSDAGRYECAVDNGIAPSVKADAKLIVRFKPEIQKGVHLSKVAASGDGTSAAVLVCKAEGIPNVQFSWAKKGVALDSQSHRYSMKTLHEGSLHTSTLTIVNVSAVLDYALFTCTATNLLGVDSFDIQLVSTSRPDPPTHLTVVSFTHNSVTLAWSAGFDGGLDQKFRVRYHWKEAPSFMYVDVFPPQATTFTITGLNPDTPYNFSVNAINILGESDYADGGAVLTVTTQEKIMPDVPWVTPSAPTLPKPEAYALPLYLIAILSVAGGILLLSNASFLGCFIRKCYIHPLAGDAMKKGGSPKSGSLNEYGNGELINVGAKQTLLIDSTSERSSSLYESYEQDSSSDAGLYYYPIRDYKPSLMIHHEMTEGETDDTQSFQGRTFQSTWSDPLDPYEYDEVADHAVYEEVGGPYPQSLTSTYSTRTNWPNDNFLRVNHWKGKSLASFEEPKRYYSDVAELSPLGQDYEVPFEMRGQLV